MDNRYFIICDSEPFYSNQLAENLSKKTLDFQIHVCNGVEQVKMLAQNGEIYILMIEDQFPIEERNNIPAKYKFVITRRHEEEIGDEEKPIYKYQSSDNIFEEIMKECLEQDEDIFYERTGGVSKLIGIYSPVGRIGKTTFAVTLGKEMAKKEKVLYLNLEEYSGWTERFRKESQYSLSDLLYYAKQEGGNLGIRMEMMIEHFDELDYIFPIPVSKDLKEVSYEEWKDFINILVKRSIYNTIIIDFSECVQGLWDLLQMCTTIYFPICTEPEELAKVSQFEENLKVLGYERLFHKINKIIIEKDINNFVRRIIKKEGKRCVTGGAAS